MSSGSWVVFGAALILVSTLLPLYLIRRNTFPISQRLPYVVMLEVSLLGVQALLNAVLAAFPNVSFISDCRIYLLIYSVTFYPTTAIMIVRITWLLMKDLSTGVLSRSASSLEQ